MRNYAQWFAYTGKRRGEAEWPAGVFRGEYALYPAASTLCERSWALSQLNRDAEAFADVKLSLEQALQQRGKK